MADPSYCDCPFGDAVLIPPFLLVVAIHFSGAVRIPPLPQVAVTRW